MTDSHAHEIQCAGEAGERRAICRTLGYWTELKGDRPMPLVGDVRLDKHVPDLAAYMFVLTRLGTFESPIIERCGDVVRAFCRGCDPIGLAVEKVFPHPLGDNLPYLVRNVIEYGKPISNTGLCRMGTGRDEIPYRTMLLPLTLNGATVDRVLGVVGCGQTLK